jgi:hypothetical protein
MTTATDPSVQPQTNDSLCRHGRARPSVDTRHKAGHDDQDQPESLEWVGALGEVVSL